MAPLPSAAAELIASAIDPSLVIDSLVTDTDIETDTDSSISDVDETEFLDFDPSTVTVDVIDKDTIPTSKAVKHKRKTTAGKARSKKSKQSKKTKNVKKGKANDKEYESRVGGVDEGVDLDDSAGEELTVDVKENEKGNGKHRKKTPRYVLSRGT